MGGEKGAGIEPFGAQLMIVGREHLEQVNFKNCQGAVILHRSVAREVSLNLAQAL